jgi:SRSO17 transposase
MKYSELETLRDRLDQFLAETLFPACSRHQQRHWGGVYVRGLLLDGERKSVGAMAGRMLDGNEQNMQQFVSQSTWDFPAVRQRLAQCMEPLLTDEAVWAIDETSFPKKGEHSVGVAHQYCGALGKVANCQVCVSIHLATAVGSVPMDFELVIPQKWSDDPVRCEKAGIPEDRREHRTKWELALDLVARVRTWKLVDRVVTADADYGRVTEFRDSLQESNLRYVVATEGKMGCWVGDMPGGPRKRTSERGRTPTSYDYEGHTPLTPGEVARQLSPDSWQEITWRKGTKSALRSRFAAVRIRAARGYQHGAHPRRQEWLLIEWPSGASEPEGYWVSNLPEDTNVQALVRYAKLRWFIENDYRQLKEELGLDHFEGRSWTGWNRHVTLTVLAYAFLLTERVRRQKKGTQQLQA